MRRYLAALLAALQLLSLSALAAEWDPGDPMLWEPDLPTFDGPMPRPGETAENFSIVLSFTGDMLLASLHGKRTAGSFLDYAAREGPEYFLQHVRPVFEADDFTVVNLENVLTDRGLTPKEKNTDPAYWFRSGTANTDILTSSGVEAVSLANNHTGDYGDAGYRDTVDAVSAAGLEYGTNNRTFYLEKNGFRIAVICHGLWNEAQAETIVRRLEEAESRSDFQIVFYHGGAEGVHAPEPWRVRASRRLVEPEMMERIEKEIVAPTVAGLKKDGLPYRGFLYFGLMLTPNGPKVIEYNCRFGDPECQAVMPLLSGDLASFCLHGAKGEFAPEEISFQNGWSVCCVLASKGYPETSHSGDAIQGLDDISNASVYHAGTKWNADKNCYETNGGRVLAVVAQGDTLSEARQRAHNEIKKIQFHGMQRRPDIGFASFV